MNTSANFLTIVAIAGSAALASVMGGAIALWRQSTTLFMSIALGFASGVLLATITSEKLPAALELASVSLAVGGFVTGLLGVYAFDLYIHRGRLVGEKAQQQPLVRASTGCANLARRRHYRVTGGTSAEEIIEGLSVGVGTAIKPGLGVLIGLAIAIDNLSEGLSIGELIRADSQRKDRHVIRQTLGRTALIGASVLTSVLLGWWLLRDLSDSVLSFLFATGAGGMFYLTVTDLLPESEERHYQESAGLSVAAGFIIIFILSQFN